MKYIFYENLFGHMEKFRKKIIYWHSPMRKVIGYEYLHTGEIPFLGANGNPFPARFAGNYKWKDISPVPGSINCCMSVLAAFYKEWERLQGVDFFTDSCEDNRRLSSNVSKYFAISWPLPAGSTPNTPLTTFPFHFEKGGAFPLSKTGLNVLINDSQGFVLSNPCNMRRGDFAQIFWNKTFGSIPTKVSELPGHAIFIHDVLVAEQNEVWFQILSAQGKTDTKGVGVMGSGVNEYGQTEPVQKNLYEKGNWFKFNGRQISIGRFRRPFPCWPCTLPERPLDKLPLPETLYKDNHPEGTLHHDDAMSLTAEQYFNNADSVGHGFYPIGLNRTWHGGIHLKPGKAQPIRAISDGVIVAARCLKEDTELARALADKKQAEGSDVLPSRNFVLIRHQVKISGSDKIFYSLYMHLSGKWEPIQLPDKQNDEPDELDPVDLLDPSTPFPSPHYQLFERQIFPRWLWQSHQEPKKLTCGYRNVGKGLDAGDTVLLAYPVAAGEVIGFTEGEYIHIEIFSKEDISGGDYPEKNSIVNKDHTKCLNSMSVLQDLRIKVENFCRINNTLLNLGVVSSNVLLQGEIARFFIHGDEIDRKSLRGLVLCHTSEWSDQIEWVKFQNTEAWGYYDDAAANKLKEITKLYAWMTKDIAKHCGLPEDHILYHYHSIQFIEWLAQKVKKGEAEQLIQDTTPFLENAGKRFDVNGKMRPPQWIVNTKKAQSLALFSEPAIGSVIMPFQKETGPWEQLDEHTDDKGNKYIKVSADPARWICVKSGGQGYVKEKY